MLPFHVSCVRLVRSTLVALWTPPTFWSPRILRIKIPPWLQVLIQLELRQKKLQDTSTNSRLQLLFHPVLVREECNDALRSLEVFERECQFEGVESCLSEDVDGLTEREGTVDGRIEGDANFYACPGGVLVEVHALARDTEVKERRVGVVVCRKILSW